MAVDLSSHSHSPDFPSLLIRAMPKDTPAIDILASETGIVAEVWVGAGDERKKARVQLGLAELPAKDRKSLERMVREAVQRGS